MSVNANVNADEYIVTLFNRYAQQVPVTEYNRLWEQQNAGTNVFGEMHNGQVVQNKLRVGQVSRPQLRSRRGSRLLYAAPIQMPEPPQSFVGLHNGAFG